MSITDAARFAKDLATDRDLVERVKAKASGLASLVELGKAHGYDFTHDEIKQVVRSAAKRDLSEDELDAVAGGKASSQPGSSGPPAAVMAGPLPPTQATTTQVVASGPTSSTQVLGPVAVVIL